MRKCLLVSIWLIGIGSAAAYDDVFDKSDIARERMHRLWQGLQIYTNDWKNLPAEPHQLFPEYVSDPLAFWHPGDSDPAPTTIDNSIPNAPNSARISFDWSWNFFGTWDEAAIFDNTSENNDDRFINTLTFDGVIETEPPLATPTPTHMALAQGHLKRFATALLIYQNDNYERFPDDFIRLWEGKFFRSTRTFWNPGDSDPLPERITNSRLNDPESVQVSFEYLLAGRNINNVEPDEIAVRDNSIDNNAGYGINVARLDGRVEFIPDCPGDVTGNNRVGVRDLVTLVRGFRIPDGAANPWDGDVNGDSVVDLTDLWILLRHFGDDCRPLAIEEEARP